MPISIESPGGAGCAVEFPEEQVTVDLELSQVRPGVFQIKSVPAFVEAAEFGDIIEAEPKPNGGLRFVRVVEKGGWRTYDLLVSREKIESEEIRVIQERVMAMGGHWERVFGGVLFFCLPAGTEYDPTDEVRGED